MKFLIDNNLSPKLSILLNESGFDAKHLVDLNLQTASDKTVFKKAYDENRVIISADTDFGYLLSSWDKNHPSLILFRNFSTITQLQFEAIKLILKEHEEDLISGSIFAVESSKIRIRKLPIF